MKIWIRILVSLAVILVVGFSIWFFAFREKDEVQAYNRTAELIDFKESLAIKDDLVKLGGMNYVGNNSDNVLDNSTATGKEIYRLRALTLGSEPITGESSSGVGYIYQSYRLTDLMIDDVLEYLLPYTKTDTVKGKSLSALKKRIDTYINNLQDLNTTLDELLLFQSKMEDNDTNYEALKGRYSSFRNKYRDNLNCASKLIMSIMEFIDVSVYGDRIMLDTHMSLFDAFARALDTSTSIDIVQENDYANDLYVVMKRIGDVDSNVVIFTDKYTEYDFLSSYNQLYNNHKDALEYVFSSKNLEKKQMAGGLSLSSISKNAQEYVINILNVLGYVGA